MYPAAAIWVAPAAVSSPWAGVASVADPDEPAADLVSRVVRALAAMVTTHPALGALLASAIAPGNPSPAGHLLRDNMHAQLEAVLDLRVPGIHPDDRTRVARILLDVVLTLLPTVGHLAPAEQMRTAQEYADLIITYLDAKFPPEGDPAWSDPGPRIRPISPAPQVSSDRPT